MAIARNKALTVLRRRTTEELDEEDVREAADRNVAAEQKVHDATEELEVVKELLVHAAGDPIAAPSNGHSGDCKDTHVLRAQADRRADGCQRHRARVAVAWQFGRGRVSGLHVIRQTSRLASSSVPMLRWERSLGDCVREVLFQWITRTRRIICT